jgi:hypothetical protein
MKRVVIFAALAAIAFVAAACGTLNPNISSADGTFIGIGGKANPDGTAEGAIGYGNFALQFVPAVDNNQKPITVTGKCGEQHELSAIIVTNNGATGGVGSSGISNAFSAGAVVATGPAAQGIAHSQEIQAAKASGGVLPSSYFDQVGQNGLTACAK